MIATPKAELISIGKNGAIEPYSDAVKVGNMLFLSGRKGLQHFGAFTGLAWCTGQILSFIPSSIGEAACAASLILWAVHWRFVARSNQ